MGELIDLPRGYKLGRVAVHEWTQHLTITRERDADGDFCICWVGTFALVADEGGGHTPLDGTALGVLPDGTTAIETEWPDSPTLAEGVEVSTQGTPRWPLARAIWLAQQLAQVATILLPAVDASLDAGDTMDQFEAASDELLNSDAVDTWEGAVLGTALSLLWLSEHARRSLNAGE